MRHVALFVTAFEETEHFYTALMGMEVEWRPDPDNVYLTSGNDNLALHRVAEATGPGQLDHIGFFIDEMDAVDRWFDFLKSEGIRMATEPRTHRDGARSFYCLDPSGVRVQIIYHPPIAEGHYGS
ncbi:MAG: VOC family protein [Proteobacteria bacterium]|nr:VOC family protein [Pseudomonadota bacterium]